MHALALEEQPAKSLALAVARTIPKVEATVIQVAKMDVKTVALMDAKTDVRKVARKGKNKQHYPFRPQNYSFRACKN